MSQETQERFRASYGDAEVWWESAAANSWWRYHMPGAWFWQDDDCDEPMGPFESRAEAVDDYRSLRDFAAAMNLVPEGATR